MAGDNEGAVRMLMLKVECEENDRDKAEAYKDMARIYKESDMERFMQYS